MNRRLYRSVSDRKIGGVAAGTATYFDIDPSISRVLWLLLAIFTGGAFLLVYLVMWAVVPEEPWTPTWPRAAARQRLSRGEPKARPRHRPMSTAVTRRRQPARPGRSQSRSRGGRGPTSSSG